MKIDGDLFVEGGTKHFMSRRIVCQRATSVFTDRREQASDFTMNVVRLTDKDDIAKQQCWSRIRVGTSPSPYAHRPPQQCVIVCKSS